MDRLLFDQTVNLYFKTLLKAHCNMVRNSALSNYLYKKSIMFAYADYYTNVLNLSREYAFKLLLMDKEEQDAYTRHTNMIPGLACKSGSDG